MSEPKDLKKLTIEDFDKALLDFIAWLDTTDHSSFNYITEVESNASSYKWNVVISIKRNEDDDGRRRCCGPSYE